MLSEKQQRLINQFELFYPKPFRDCLHNNSLTREKLKIHDLKLILLDLETHINCEGEIFANLLKPFEQEILDKFGLDQVNKLTLKQFKDFIFDHPSLSLDYVKDNLKFYLKETPLVFNSLFEFGYQSSACSFGKRLYYLKFYDLLMIDIDHKINGPQVDNIIDKVIKFCEKRASFLFDIWESYAGLHLILLSHAIPYNSKEAIDLMKALDCDEWYLTLSSNFGFKYRLTPKLNRTNDFVARPLKTVGKGRPHPKCVTMLNLYKSYLTAIMSNYDEFKIQPNEIKLLRGTPVQDPGFYSSFVERVIKKGYLEEGYDAEIVTSELVGLISKPQQLIESSKDFYIALDQKTLTYYICYRDLMMIDLDLHKMPKTEIVISNVNETLNNNDNKDNNANDNSNDNNDNSNDNNDNNDNSNDNNNDDNNDNNNDSNNNSNANDNFIMKYLLKTLDKENNAIEIYRSLHGYHLFLIDKPRLYSDFRNFQMMINLGCDYYYSIFSLLRGFCVRLNKKQYKCESHPIYSYIGFYGNEDLIDPRLKLYTRIHYHLLSKYQDVPNCKMK